MYLSSIKRNILWNAENQTRVCWVISKYATSELCSPLQKLLLVCYVVKKLHQGARETLFIRRTKEGDQICETKLRREIKFSVASGHFQSSDKIELRLKGDWFEKLPTTKSKTRSYIFNQKKFTEMEHIYKVWFKTKIREFLEVLRKLMHCQCFRSNQGFASWLRPWSKI